MQMNRCESCAVSHFYTQYPSESHAGGFNLARLRRLQINNWESSFAKIKFTAPEFRQRDEHLPIARDITYFIQK